MTITYEVGSGLYVNITNRCTNSCDFCVRSVADGTYGELWLEKEPTCEQILDDIKARDLSKYSELVFCGYGEPAIRLDDILAVAEKVKSFSSIPVRINTNGHANLIYGCDVTPKLQGLIDCVSVSLNAATAEKYEKLCHPIFGVASFNALIEFAKAAKNYVPKVMFSIVRGSIPDEDIELCQKLADESQITLKIREYIK